MTSTKCSESVCASVSVTGAVHHDHAAERRLRIALQRVREGVLDPRPHRHAARVRVLDDHAHRQRELARDVAAGGDVGDVVERDAAAGVLVHHRQHVAARPALGVVGGALVRVLAVRQLGVLDHLDEQPVREVDRLGEPVRDRGVVARGVRERLGGQLAAGRQRQREAVVVELGQHEAVPLRVAHDGHVAEVLGRRAEHRRAADVDVLDELGLVDVAPAGEPLERVQVDDDEVDRLDPAALQRGHVAVLVPARQDPAVHRRVERLHAPAEHLRGAGQVLDQRDLDARLPERLRGAGGGHDLDAPSGQRVHERDQPRLVGNRDECPADLVHESSTSITRALRPVSSTRSVASSVTARGRSRCSASWRRAPSVSGSSS